MIPKTITLTPPWDDRKVVHLEMLLASLFRNGLQSRMGTYTGDGVDDRSVTFGMKALFIYIQRKAAGAGNATFALREAGGVSFVPGSGFVSDAVKSFTSDGVTLGTNADVNASGVDYAYIGVG